MALPDQCELRNGYLVFWELARPEDLADEDRIYEHTCFVACTNGLRPMGRSEVLTHPYPELAPGTQGMWGGRSVTDESLREFRDSGYVLCELRLPVAPMGAAASPLPPMAGGPNR